MTAYGRSKDHSTALTALSLVNRELARGLSRAGETVALISRDGPGPFEPNQKFLAQDAEVRDMWLAGKASDVIDVNLRNQYPPFVADMRGAVRGLAIYAWEESGFPERYVAEFNSTLNLITVPSRFVAKVLRDNGVYTPIRVVGEGCDHVLDAAAPDLAARARGATVSFSARFIVFSAQGRRRLIGGVGEGLF